MTINIVDNSSLFSANLEEVEAFAGFVEKYRRGEVPEDEFKRTRLIHGIYGQRQPGVHMVRIKLPWGGLNSAQLARIADVAERFASGKGHVTTRQDIQLHFVKLADVPETMLQLARAGLTTREACGNSVRNVTACPYAGISPREVFDVTPHALAVSRYLLRHRLTSSLPRKFKISFQGCDGKHGAMTGCSLAGINDIGCAAVMDKDGRSVRGFRVYVGGGLGPQPQSARIMEEFLPETRVIPFIEAVIRVFNRHGERRDKNRARLKWLIRKMGFDWFRREVDAEREAVRRELGDDVQIPLVDPEGTDHVGHGPTLEVEHSGHVHDGPGYAVWRSTNVEPQRQEGFSSVTVFLPRGDITAPQLRSLAAIAEKFSRGRMRTTQEQNILLRWVRTSDLSNVHSELIAAGLGSSGAGTCADIVSCPGADSCRLGITRSMGLARTLHDVMRNGPGQDADLRGLTIKVSGCPNSCAQHHLAGIGFHGGSRRSDGKTVPAYMLYLGGGPTDKDGLAFGRKVGWVPARRVPVIVKALVALYREKKLPGQGIADFLRTVDSDSVRRSLTGLMEFLPESQAPDLYSDWGEDTPFKVETGEGECAA